jgi:tRNA nucleotidyltransferase (CCA-adding enzyme)
LVARKWLHGEAQVSDDLNENTKKIDAWIDDLMDRISRVVRDGVDPKNNAAVRAAIGNEDCAALLTMGRFLLENPEEAFDDICAAMTKKGKVSVGFSVRLKQRKQIH